MHRCTRSDGDDLCGESICLKEGEQGLTTALRSQREPGTTTSMTRAAVIRPAAGLLNAFEVHNVHTVIPDP